MTWNLPPNRGATGLSPNKSKAMPRRRSTRIRWTPLGKERLRGCFLSKTLKSWKKPQVFDFLNAKPNQMWTSYFFVCPTICNTEVFWAWINSQGKCAAQFFFPRLNRCTPLGPNWTHPKLGALRDLRILDFTVQAKFRRPLLKGPSELHWSTNENRVICPPHILSFLSFLSSFLTQW